MEGGYARSHLWLNDGLEKIDEWDEQSIKDRAERLVDRALDVWGGPPASISEGFHPVVVGVADDGRPDGYEYLGRGGVTRTLFESLRVQVLALDACVSEEFLRRYIAYKAETNFVDVVPQASGLQLTLNMAFADLDDPLGMASDVTGVGRWGNSPGRCQRCGDSCWLRLWRRGCEAD